MKFTRVKASFCSSGDKTVSDFPCEEIVTSDLSLAPQPFQERLEPCPLGLRWDFPAGDQKLVLKKNFIPKKNFTKYTTIKLRQENRPI